MSFKMSDWYCDCGERNFSNRLKCRICSKRRYNAPLSSLDNARMGDWECVCGILNFSNRYHCYKCGKQKGYDISITTQDGDWKCSECNVSNFKRRDKCYKCGVGKSTQPTQSTTTTSTQSTQSTQPSFKPGDWYCRECNELNFRSRVNCFKCGVGKQTSELSGESNEKISEQTDCVICMDKKKCFVITGCGHLCYCEDCGRDLTQCPMCRKPYNPQTQLLKIYS